MNDMTSLHARITAQSLILEALIDALVSVETLDISAVTRRLECFIDAPKAGWISPVVCGAVVKEVDAWIMACTV